LIKNGGNRTEKPRGKKREQTVTECERQNGENPKRTLKLGVGVEPAAKAVQGAGQRTRGFLGFNTKKGSRQTFNTNDKL